MTAQMVRDIAAEAFGDAIDILQMIETLEAGNTSAAVAAVNAAGTYAVAQCIYRSLWSRLVVIVTRAVQAEVEKRGNPAMLAEAIALWAKCRSDHRWPSINAFRDKQIAHWGSLKNSPPIINDLFAVSRATTAALERLAQGAGVVALSLDSQVTNYRTRAEDFWGP